MKYFFLSLAAVCLLMVSCKTNKNSTANKIQSGVVTFEVLSVGAGTETSTGNSLIVEFDSALTKMQDEPAQMGAQLLFIDNKTQKQTVYLDMPGGKKVALAMGDAKEAENITFLEETKEIAGYTCKKAIVKYMGQDLDVFYTKEIPVNNAFGFKFDGFLMEYAMPGPQASKQVYRATKVEPKAVALKLPEGYEAMTMEVFQKEMRQQGPPVSEFITEGAQFKDFTITDMEGKGVSLEDLKGKVAVINFWFVACMPCIMELPQLNEVVDKFEGKDVEFLAITFDKDAKVKKLITEKPFKYRLFNNQMDMIRDLQIAAFPTNIVLDKSGKVVKSKLGFSPVIGEELTEVIEKALN